MIITGQERQKEIYLPGSLGTKPSIPLDTISLEEQAKKVLSKKSFDYIAAGAGNELGIKNNLDAFKKYELTPKMAMGMGSVDISTKFLNIALKAPIMYAPIGVLNLAHRNGDNELASAAQHLQVPMIISNQASSPMETICQSLGNAPSLFQLYFSKSNELVESLVSRANNCGCKGIILTLDTTQLGWRNRDLSNGYLPFIEGQGIAQYTSDPVFKKMVDAETRAVEQKLNWNSLLLYQKITKNYPGNYFKNLVSKRPVKSVRKFIEIYSRTTLNWDDIKWLRSICKIPLILKGILHVEDAKKAIDLGADAIVVSNHGGRQIDQAISSLDAIAEIRKNIPSDYPLALDSGIRTGTDIFISLALGANVILLGRPYVYALAIKGSQGVMEYTKNTLAELEIIMHLMGCNNLNDISNCYLRIRNY